MALKMGVINTLDVLRETDIAFVLSDGEEEVFLHKREVSTAPVPGETVDVFLYFDGQKRVTATMTTPIVGMTEPAFCKVVDVNSRLGVFLNIGINKDLLLSRDDLPFTKVNWPAIGDQIFIRLRASKNQLTAKIIPRYDIPMYLKPETELIEGESYDAYVVFFAEEGIVLTTKEGHNIFVYFKHLRKDYRLGEEVNVKITNVKSDNTYNGTLVAQKELLISDDALAIKSYLEKHKGQMPITDKSDPQLIYETFKMSKSSFKRALGSLYKEKIVILEPNLVTLVNNETTPKDTDSVIEKND